MKKLLISLAVVIIGGTAAGFVLYHHSSTTPTTTVTKKATPSKPKTITTAEVTSNDNLRYSCIIYYAVKHVQIQRWQELADFERGWQVEIYSENNQVKYLVWPDKNITTAAKQLQPNWFTVKGNQVTYDSFGVHTFQKDMTATVNMTQIVSQIKTDHAAHKVRQMRPNLVVKDHRK